MRRRRRRRRQEPHARDELASRARRMERYPPPVAGDDVARVGEPANLDLDALERGIDVARRPRTGRLLTEDVPRLDALPELERDAARRLDLAADRKAKFVVGREPAGIERKSPPAQTVDGCVQVLPDE